MANWFNIINIQNITIFMLGFIIGRFWRVGKKIIKQINSEDNNLTKQANSVNY